MNFHRFLAYTVLACWIGLTAVVVGTALQWSAARGATEVKIQRALNAQKEATADTVSDAARDSKAGREDDDVSSADQRAHDRLVWRAADASEEMAEAITSEKIVQRQFWWEFAVWGGLTLLSGALLAERRESDERSGGSR
jgi:hypothetical protein